MTDYDLVPNDSALDGVRCYGDSLGPLTREQEHGAAIETFEPEVAPTTAADGLAPGQINFNGQWLGSEASALADRLRSIAADAGTTELTVQAVDSAGNNVADPVNGTYVIAEDISVEQVVPGKDVAYSYDITLSEE